MKKILLGFVAGAVLMFSAQAFGDGISFTGKKVDGQAVVTINKKEIGTAIIIEGKSFVPVREVTNGFGGKVDSTNGGVIALSSTEDTVNQSSIEKSIEVNSLNQQIEKQKKAVDLLKLELSNLDKQVAELKVKADADNSEVGFQRTQYSIFSKVFEERKADLPIAEAKLADLESQLAALK